ncbi:hypothetical protein WSM22_21400 [Cytophagales bacterium WSM2-2]|nr:hypothetical protein WSM22_21400 [Cytophagales bacterium WSM2-2]
MENNKRSALVAFVIVSVLSSVVTSVQAQNSAIDSLKRLLLVQTDSARVLTLNELAYKYLAYEPLTAKRYAEEAIDLSRKLKYLPGELNGLHHLGDYEYRQSNYAKVIELETQVIKLAAQIPDSILMADAYRLLGNVHTYGLKQYDEALEYQRKALQIYTSRKEKRRMSALDGSMTWIFAITGQNLPEAHRMAKEGLALATALHDHQLISYNYNSLGLISYKMGNLDSALIYLGRSNAAARLANDNAVITYNKTIMGSIYVSQKNYWQAVEIFNQALGESNAINLREARKDAYEGLAKAYKELSNFEKAYENQERFIQLRDSLLNWEITQKSLSLKAGYEESRREAQITELKNENERASLEKKVTFIVFGAIILFLGAVGVLIVRNSRERKVANHLLQEKNDEIETQNEELTQSREELAQQSEVVSEQNQALRLANDTKDKLFSIISHDLRGPIASLRSLLGLVMRGAVTTEEFQKMAPKLNQSIGSIHETLENLLQWSYAQMSGLSYSPVEVEINSLVSGNIGLFAEAAKVKHIELIDETNGQLSVFADENQAKLIMRNLINNAIKFTPDGGKVVVSSRQNSNMVEISVRDSGIGIPPDRVKELFEPHTRVSTVGTHGEKGTGLGLLLCHEMAQRNEGKLSVISEVGIGTSFILSLPSKSR